MIESVNYGISNKVYLKDYLKKPRKLVLSDLHFDNHPCIRFDNWSGYWLASRVECVPPGDERLHLVSGTEEDVGLRNT